MQTLPLPYEVKASFRVSRHKADKVVSKFKTGISFPGLLPDALKSSDAGVDPDAGEGSEATLWVLFKPRHHANRVAQRSSEAQGAAGSEPVAESAYCEFIGAEKGTSDSA
jgi:hypothetical protein